MKRVAFFPAFLLLLSLFFVSTALAQVQVRLRAIQASNSGTTIDPSLRDVHDQLGSLFSFTSYRILRDENLNLAPNQPVYIQGRHPGRSMEVTLVGLRRDVAELKIRVIREGVDILNTQVRLFPGRTVLIGGPKHAEGVIIFAVSARF